MVSTKPPKDEFLHKLKHQYTVDEVVEMLMFEPPQRCQEILDQYCPGYCLKLIETGKGSSTWAIVDSDGQTLMAMRKQ